MFQKHIQNSESFLPRSLPMALPLIFMFPTASVFMTPQIKWDTEGAINYSNTRLNVIPVVFPVLQPLPPAYRGLRTRDLLPCPGTETPPTPAK